MNKPPTEETCVVRRSVNPASHLNRIGQLAFDRASDDASDPQLDLITSNLMCALTLEAVLNYVGRGLYLDLLENPPVFRLFEQLDATNKVRAIGSTTGVVFLGRGPFQELSAIFEFRHRMVHGRPMSKGSSTLGPAVFDADGYLNGVPDELLLDWERQVSLDTAAKWRESVIAMSDELGAAADCSFPHRMRDHTDYWRTHGQRV